MSLKKIVVSSAKFNVLISWYHIRTYLILVLSLMEIGTTSKRNNV